MQGSGCGVERVWFIVKGVGTRVQDSGFRVQGSGFRVQGSGFRVEDSGFRVQGSGSVPARAVAGSCLPASQRGAFLLPLRIGLVCASPGRKEGRQAGRQVGR